MPNWCMNYLTIRCKDKEHAKEIKGRLRGVPSYHLYNGSGELYGDHDFNETQIEEMKVDFTFNSFVPVPQDVLDKGYSGQGIVGSGYRWQIDHWGTKWEPSDVEFNNEENDNELDIHFQTAWSPPIEWTVEASKVLGEDVDMEIMYAEEGTQFAGYIEYCNGEVVEQHQVSGDDRKEYRDFIETHFGNDPYEHMIEDKMCIQCSDDHDNDSEFCSQACEEEYNA